MLNLIAVVAVFAVALSWSGEIAKKFRAYELQKILEWVGFALMIISLMLFAAWVVWGINGKP